MQERYSRNRIYVRPEEQQLVKNFRILLGGADIGSIIAECALRFGFETITIADGEVVEESDLNRQNYRMCDIGKPKAETLKERLLGINPDARITAINASVDADNAEGLVKEHDIAINALDFSSGIPFLFDGWCQKYNIPVIHPYNIGWGGLVIVTEPTGPQLKDFADSWEDFDVHLIGHIVNYFKFWMHPKPWMEDIITQHRNEKSTQPLPQLSVASWIAAGLCTNLIFCIATGQKVKRFPKFYLSSVIDDRN